MSELLARLRSVFVAPAVGGVGPLPMSRAMASPRVALLCPRSEALAAGATLALGLARDTGAAAGVVCLWSGSEPWRLPGRGPLAHPAARRLASRLGARELRASATGRLARVVLPADPLAAVTAAARAGAATAGPVVTVLCGARDDIVDQALALQDLIVVGRAPDTDAALVHLVEAGLVDLGVPTLACDLGSGAFERGLAAWGLSPRGGLRRALTPAIAAAS